MKLFRQFAMLVVAGVALICTGSVLYAQSTTGTIFGTVTDSTGAAIPNATVVLTEVRTGVKQETATNGKGEYTYAIVNPGEYSVSTSVTGFKSETQTGIALAADQNIRVPFMLATGAVTETVSVEAGVTLVDTREAQIGETIEQDKLENLPTQNRDSDALLTTVPGVTNYTADSEIGTRGGLSVSVNGLSTDAASYYLDGSYDNDLASNGGAKIPNPDALSEFRVLTSNFDAEFGRSPSAVINAITRSGTEHFHGAAYDFIRNNILNARNYFTQAPSPTTPVPQFQQNQFGARLGGPLMFLHQSFFFFDYQGTVQRAQNIKNQGSVLSLTNAERAGNFTDDANNKVFGTTGTFKIPTLPKGANCGTTAAPVICNGTNYNPALSGTNGSANNYLDAVAQNVLKLVPVGGDYGSAIGFHVIPQEISKADSISNEGTARFDINRIRNHQIEAMIFYTKGNDTTPYVAGNDLAGYGGSNDLEQQFNIVAADVWTISPKIVNSFRAFTSRNHYTIFNEYNGPYAQQLGAVQVVPAGAFYAQSQFGLTGYINIGGTAHGPANVNQVTYGGIDTMNLNLGTHSVKVGGSYAYQKFFNNIAKAAGGNYTFTGSSTGNTFADFLLGEANQLNQGNTISHNNYTYDPSIYAQDDWQITHRLNLNLGVRWEVFPPYFGDSTYGTFQAGVQSTVIPSAPVGILYQGDPGVPQGIFNTSYKNFAPRVGFAYDAFGDGKTSIRGGFGLFFFEQNAGNSNGQVQTPYNLTIMSKQTANLVCPYGLTTPTTAGSGCPFTTAVTPAGQSLGLGDPFPYNPATLNFGSVAAGQTVFAVSPSGGATPYVYEYNLTLEQQLTPTMAMHIAYVGNSLRKGYLTNDINSPVFTPGAAITNPGVILRRPYEPYRNSTGGPLTASSFLFGAINLDENSDNGQYSSLQTTLRARLNRKLNVLLSYVWSKSLDYSGAFVNPSNIAFNYGASPNDIRNRFVASYVFQLPNTRHFGVVGREVLNGWRLNGITALQSGSNFTITSGVDTNRDGLSTNDRVNIVGNPFLPHMSRAQRIQFGTINPNAIAVPCGVTADPTCTNPYGNEQKNMFYGPGNINTNLSIFKEFAIKERVRLQFRAESFNVFGNVNLNNPRTGLTNIQNPLLQLPIVGQGQITSAGPARTFQFALKALF